jgi:hypothetical protein
VHAVVISAAASASASAKACSFLLCSRTTQEEQEHAFAMLTLLCRENRLSVVNSDTAPAGGVIETSKQI